MLCPTRACRWLVPNAFTHSFRSLSHLKLATQNGHPRVVRSLLAAAGCDVNAQVGGYSPIVVAAQYGEEAIAKILIDAGADVRKTTKKGG